MTDSRDSSYGLSPAKRRRRKCRGCGFAFTTYEVEASAYAAVLKATALVDRLEGPLAELRATLAMLGDMREVA